MIELHYLSAFLLGLFGASHCLGMCGGISAAFGLSVQSPRGALTVNKALPRIMAFNIARVCCYATLGALVGFAGWLLAETLQPALLILRLLAGFMLIAMGCYIAQWWMGLTVLENAGQKLWRYIQPLTRPFLPMDSLSKAFAAGFLWGLLPCGLIYSVLLWASMRAHWFDAALTLFCFGLGTLPGMVAMAFSSASLKQWLQKKSLRQVIALLLIAFGLWTMAGYNLHHHHNSDNNHTHHAH